VARKLARAQIDGTYRKDRHVDPVQVAPGSVEPPESLTGLALEVWERYITPRCDLGFYEPAEAPALALWCQYFVHALAAIEQVPLGGVVEYEDDFGRTQFMKHPAVGVSLRLSAEFRALSARLGLDPIARMQLAAPRQPDGTPDLPSGAPPAFQPKVVRGGKAASRKR
jgi:P27 family predicted phage terminase small subunit